MARIDFACYACSGLLSLGVASHVQGKETGYLDLNEKPCFPIQSVETDPQFTNQKTWLSSDYMLKSVALDPAMTQKRLGDGFYEQKLIREQVAQLTGRRFIGDYTNDDQQYQALMNNGLTTAQSLNLRPGIALSPAQMALLTSDMVWLVEQTVTLADGSKQTVLAPQLYVRVKPGDLDCSGSLISADTVNMNLTAAKVDMCA
jgi:filamentous hemagglutinin